MKLWETESEGNSDKLEEKVEEFTTSGDLEYDERLAGYDIIGSLAHVRNLEDIEVLPSEEAEELTKELIDLLEKDLSLEPEDEDVHTKIESLITDELGEVGRKLHTGRSRNDQILVDLRLFAKDKLLEISKTLLETTKNLCSFVEEHGDVPMVGYTHTRKAMPSSVGMWGSSFGEAFLEDLEALKNLLEVIDSSPLGAGAGYGVPLSLNRELAAELLGFSDLVENSLYAVSSRGKTEFRILSFAASVHLDLARLSSDLILFSGEEFDFFDLPRKFTTGSSIMPQKKNPDVLEIIRGKSSGYLGNLAKVYSTSSGLLSGYHRDQQELKVPLMEGLDTTESCLEMIPPLIEGLEVDEEKMEEGFSEELLAADEVFRLVDRGVPFRRAYRQVKEKLEKGSFSDEGGNKIREILNAGDHRGGTARPGIKKIERGVGDLEDFFVDKIMNFEEKLEELTTI